VKDSAAMADADTARAHYKAKHHDYHRPEIDLADYGKIVPG